MYQGDQWKKPPHIEGSLQFYWYWQTSALVQNTPLSWEVGAKIMEIKFAEILTPLT